MKALRILLILLLVFAVLLIGTLLYLNHYVQTPALKELVLGTARDALGAEVKISNLNVSLFSGVALRGVAVENPEGYPGQLLTADAFVLRYRLLPLLRRRVEVEEVSLQKPTITLARNDKGEWNYEVLTAAAAGSPAAPLEPGRAARSAPTGGLNISLSRVSMEDGEVVMLGEGGKELVRIDKIGLATRVNFEGGKLNGSGKASIGTINLANSLFVRLISAPVTISAEQIALNPLSGTLAGGTVSGDITLKLADEFKYALRLQVKDGDVDKLLQEAGTRPMLNGKLQATVALEGTGGLPTMAGNGRAEITDGRLGEIPTLNLVAVLLQIPELRDLKFGECVLEFTITNNTMQTPVIRLSAPRVQITGKGNVSLDDYALNHDMTLAVGKELLARVPKEVRNVFTERADGFFTIDFRVWGPYDSPKENLKARIVRGATDQLIEKGLQKLFKQ